MDVKVKVEVVIEMSRKDYNKLDDMMEYLSQLKANLEISGHGDDFDDLIAYIGEARNLIFEFCDDPRVMVTS